MTLLSLNNYSDLLEKCTREIDELCCCHSHPDYDFILFNIVLGMNHVFEWYLKEKTIITPKKLSCITKFNPFSSPYDVSYDFKVFYRQLSNFPNTNRYQEIIRKLCNKAKHFKKTPLERQNKNFTSSFGANHMQCGNPDAVCGAFDHYIYSVDIDGTEEDLSNLLSFQIKAWNKFVKENV